MKKRIFLTGATGSMGFEGLKQLLQHEEQFEITVLVLPDDPDKKRLRAFRGAKSLRVVEGDLRRYEDVCPCVQDADIVLHVGAFVSPQADYQPEKAMHVNYGSVVNIIRAIHESGRKNEIKLVYIGTIAETGDRMPPIHWGRVGDPIKPSIFDYYAVSKTAAERAVIESELPYWVSLRQTGIICKKMTTVNDGIIFHNCLDNVFEYITDTDSGRLLLNICGDLPERFWRRVYNIAGGPQSRSSFYDLLKELFRRMGLNDISLALKANWFATRNFHGHYYLDSDVLNDYLHYRVDSSVERFHEAFLQSFGPLVPLSRVICRLPFGQQFIGWAIGLKFKAMAKTEHGTVHFIKKDLKERIEAYFISRENWAKIPKMENYSPFVDWDTVVPIDHGYDESKPEEALSLEDVRAAARFRGGRCLSEDMKPGDWHSKLLWSCAFGHTFEASARLILHGGHWCPVCERESWNYHEVAKRSPFFAQVWYPLHSPEEPPKTYPKLVKETDIIPETP